MKKNRVENVRLVGGIVGLFMPAHKTLEAVLDRCNEDGWVVRTVLRAKEDYLVALVGIIILFLTLFIYTPLPGYIVILEKEV